MNLKCDSCEYKNKLEHVRKNLTLEKFLKSDFFKCHWFNITQFGPNYNQSSLGYYFNNYDKQYIIVCPITQIHIIKLYISYDIREYYAVDTLFQDIKCCKIEDIIDVIMHFNNGSTSKLNVLNVVIDYFEL